MTAQENTLGVTTQDHVTLDQTSHYQELFARHGCVAVPGFLKHETAELMAEELLLHYEQLSSRHDKLKSDPCCGNAFGKYGLFDAALRLLLPRVAEISRTELFPVNSYSRIYFEGGILSRHVDKPKLEISASICLSRDEVSWPLCLLDREGKEVAVVQDIGDAVIYRGELVHWREGVYPGAKQIQVFLHYCDASGPQAASYKFDGRSALGISSPRLKSRSARLLHRIRRLISV